MPHQNIVYFLIRREWKNLSLLFALCAVFMFALAACDSPAPAPLPTATSVAQLPGLATLPPTADTSLIATATIAPITPPPAIATATAAPTAPPIATATAVPTALPLATATNAPTIANPRLLPSPTQSSVLSPQSSPSPSPTQSSVLGPQSSPSPSPPQLTPGPRSARHSGRLFMAGKDDGWYVKDNTLYRWDGKRWQAVASAAPGANFESLSYISDSSIWLAGSALAHWDGATIKPVAGGNGVTYHGVSALADDDVWLSGDKPSDNAPSVGIIQHWDGIALKDYATPASVTSFSAVAMLDHSDGWAIGGRTTMRYNGKDWLVVASHTGDPLLAIDMLSPSDGWAVGRYANIIHWSGSRWDKVPGPWPPYTELVGISMVSPDDGWLIGFVNGDNRGGAGGGNLSLPRIMHWNGKQWLDVDAGGISPFMDSISMASANDGWILVPAFHWDGTEWQTHGAALQTPNPFPALP